MIATPTVFRTNRILDFASAKELTAQVGHGVADWPLVVVKELVDNALDACEDHDIAPVIGVRIDARGITVADNGPGMPPDVVADVLDYSRRVSSREAYCGITRGAQGNALSTLFALPHALTGEPGTVDVDACGTLHVVTFSIDPVAQEVVIDHQRHDGVVQNGTSVTLRWPVSASSILREAEPRIVRLIDAYGWTNPHLSLRFEGNEDLAYVATDRSWTKWKPSEASSPHFYNSDRFERLIAAYLSDDARNDRSRTVRDFASAFRGCTRSQALVSILTATNLAGAQLSSLRSGAGLDRSLIAHLLEAMQAESKPVKANILGVIGEPHLRQVFEEAGCAMGTFTYKRIFTEGPLPLVVEAAFACNADENSKRALVVGANFSPAIGGNLFPYLGARLARKEAEDDQPITVFLHLARPCLVFKDRGKGAIELDAHDEDAIERALGSATTRWTKQRKAEERDLNAYFAREDRMERRTRNHITIKDAADSVMEAAYLKASANNTLPAKARQIMYSARRDILALTKKTTLDDAYFTQTLLPDYMARHPETETWKVIWDARGHLTEPHTGVLVPLGTTDVRAYVSEATEPHWETPKALVSPVQTHGPSGRYKALLFIEKEGFDELFEAAALRERYDIATLSTKGMSVVACRELADKLCFRYNIPLFVLHDFDKSGFSILGTLRRDTRRYQYENAIDVIDLGIRLGDVIAQDLEDEPVTVKGDPYAVAANLEQNGATEAEIEFLKTKRVELNAFTSGDFIAWIEAKLERHGVCKVVPEHADLAESFRRQHIARYLDEHFPELLKRAEAAADKHNVPADLRELLEEQFSDDPALSWETAVAAVFEEQNP